MSNISAGSQAVGLISTAFPCHKQEAGSESVPRPDAHETEINLHTVPALASAAVDVIIIIMKGIV